MEARAVLSVGRRWWRLEVSIVAALDEAHVAQLKPATCERYACKVAFRLVPATSAIKVAALTRKASQAATIGRSFSNAKGCKRADGGYH
jgi:hypothetical protein